MKRKVRKILKDILFCILDILYILFVFYILYYEMTVFVEYWGTSVHIVNILCLLVILYFIRLALTKGMPSRALRIH